MKSIESEVPKTDTDGFQHYRAIEQSEYSGVGQHPQVMDAFSCIVILKDAEWYSMVL